MDANPEKHAADMTQVSSQSDVGVIQVEKKPWWHSITVMGSTLQIVVAAILGIAIGVAVSTTVDEVPEACITVLEIPGQLWLRGLKASGTYYPEYSNFLFRFENLPSPQKSCH